MKNKGVVYLGNRNTGKTTRLLNAFEDALLKKKRILVIDSATDHVEKSIAKKILGRSLTNVIYISSYPEKEIVFPNVSESDFAKQYSGESQIYICDAAYYLEKGYDFPVGEIRERFRLLYKKFSMQVLKELIDQIDVVIMDEIELIQESRAVIEEAYSKNVEIYMTLHYEEGIAGLEELFYIEKTFVF